MKENVENSYLYGGNAGFIEGLYEEYLNDPKSVSEVWRQYFDSLKTGRASDVAHTPIRNSFADLVQQPPEKRADRDINTVVQKQVAVLQLINAYRTRGFQVAYIDPLERSAIAPPAELDPGYYGLTESDMDTTFDTGTLAGLSQASLREILRVLKDTYCGTVGVEYMHIMDEEQKRWLQERLETSHAKVQLTSAEKRHILQELTAAETLEKYLHNRYVGQKRFSLQGGESVIPLLDEIIEQAGENRVEEIIMGMAHRGRLNVLVNTLGKQPCDLFKEFEGIHTDELSSGDVKYHQGFSTDIDTRSGAVHLALAFNPSHLEIVDPVVQGSVRARQQRRQDLGGERVLPLLIHGDAAFAGQGVVMETLAMSRTRGFRTGGTVHIIINNQIGFTTSDPRDTRSSVYCTDIAKSIEAPIFHVNGDDPEAVIFVARLALAYRMAFRMDVVIDLVCFRRLGHNEADEPSVTQPLMYKRIAQNPGVRKMYADKLVLQKVVGASEPEEMIAHYREALDSCNVVAKPALSNYKRSYAVDWTRFRNGVWDEPIVTAVPLNTIERLTRTLTTIPENFRLHPRVQKIVEERRQMGEGRLPLDWGYAETMAYATLLENGFAVRISGQDAGRGTFFHRHAVLHDQNREKWDQGAYIPLQNLSENQPNFLVIDSLLSEEAVLGFEYGYATTEADHLVIWEAQFGDFANGAQVVIDQFISSGEAKWGRLSGLVMMLPHGYEGQGPEHSSARLERYLQLCADGNMQIVVPTTPAQMFHLLRRQMLRQYRKPLIIFTPKSLLRHRESTSTLADLTEGRFQPVIQDPLITDPQKVERILLCSGKVYYDLHQARVERNIDNVAIIRIEQLYPFPVEDFNAALHPYAHATDIRWVQEEPKNQGAWYQVQHRLRACLGGAVSLSYVGRAQSPAPAVGYLAKHLQQQRDLVNAAFGVEQPPESMEN